MHDPTLPDSWDGRLITYPLRIWLYPVPTIHVPTLDVGGLPRGCCGLADPSDPVSQCQQPSTTLGQQLLDGELLALIGAELG